MLSVHNQNRRIAEFLLHVGDRQRPILHPVLDDTQGIEIV